MAASIVIGKRPSIRCIGFTLIELLVVLSILGLLASLVAPRYLHSLDVAKERSLVTSLSVMRDAIDQFAADKGRYPDSLDELAQARYIRAVPEDPLTGRRDSWQPVPAASDAQLKGGLADVRSGADGKARNGQHYADW